METAQLQIDIEQVLSLILNQSSEVIAHLTAILQSIVQGAGILGGIATLVSRSPALVEMANQLLALISAGATIPEIAAALAEFANTVGVSAQAIMSLLQLLASLLLV
uniref:Uncharacterized protein n=1 Tax=Desertifilum tharense IPPAS B-1220 TaxID=1781255 RepID=A0ACD5GN74_9CYAN